jgi:hypothetical protein
MADIWLKLRCPGVLFPCSLEILNSIIVIHVMVEIFWHTVIHLLVSSWLFDNIIFIVMMRIKIVEKI